MHLVWCVISIIIIIIVDLPYQDSTISEEAGTTEHTRRKEKLAEKWKM